MGVPEWGLTSFAVLQGSRTPHNPAHSFCCVVSFVLSAVCSLAGSLQCWSNTNAIIYNKEEF